MNDWIQTSTGRAVWLNPPYAGSLNIREIAHALSQINRFTGHTRCPYSVAQHSLHVASLVHPEYTYVALMHDATEAYLGDMNKPLKGLCPDYQKIEANFWAVIAEQFGLPLNLPAAVKHADCIAAVTERRDLLVEAPLCNWGSYMEGLIPDHVTLVPMTPKKAERLFLAEFKKLTGGKYG